MPKPIKGRRSIPKGSLGSKKERTDYFVILAKIKARKDKKRMKKSAEKQGQ